LVVLSSSPEKHLWGSRNYRSPLVAILVSGARERYSAVDGEAEGGRSGRVI
jgi:hypothetical protein